MNLCVIASDSDEFRARVVVPLHRTCRRTVSPPVVDIVIPVRNHESDLAFGVARLHAFLRTELPFSARITMADRASIDATGAVAELLAAELPDIRVLRINEVGRGRAVAAAWLTSDARVVASMDADPCSELSGLLPLLAPVIAGHTELSVGVSRGPRRRGLVLELATGARLATALRADVARRLLPYVVGRGGLFDAELVLHARRAGLRVYERAMV